jgi:hypothetical protein
MKFNHKLNCYFGRNTNGMLVSVQADTLNAEVVKHFKREVSHYGTLPLLRQIDAAWIKAEKIVKNVHYWVS